MKKILITIAAMLLITSLTACSGSSGESDSTSVATTEASSSKKAEKTLAAESTKVTEATKNTELSLTLSFPLVEKYVNGPRWQIVEKGYTKLYNINDTKFIALTTNDELSVNKPSEVLDALLKDFQQGAYSMCGVKSVIKYDIKDIKEMTINGTDYVRYQGYLVCEGELKEMFNCYFVGYTFICEEDGKQIPCQMIGAVVSDEQEQSDIDEITKYTDAMVYTIRNTRKIQ